MTELLVFLFPEGDRQLVGSAVRDAALRLFERFAMGSFNASRPRCVSSLVEAGAGRTHHQVNTLRGVDGARDEDGGFSSDQPYVRPRGPRLRNARHATLSVQGVPLLTSGVFTAMNEDQGRDDPPSWQVISNWRIRRRSAMTTLNLLFPILVSSPRLGTLPNDFTTMPPTVS